MNSSEDQDGNLHQLMQGRICVEIQMRNHPTQQRLDLLNWEENWKEYHFSLQLREMIDFFGEFLFGVCLYTSSIYTEYEINGLCFHLPSRKKRKMMEMAGILSSTFSSGLSHSRRQSLLEGLFSCKDDDDTRVILQKRRKVDYKLCCYPSL